MGRKKDTIKDADDHKAYDSILELFDLAGVFGSHDDESRNELLESLKNLSLRMKLWSEDSLDTMLKLEDVIQRARAACKAFVANLEHERAEIYILLREVEEKSKSDEPSTLRVLHCHSLVSAYQDQVELEEEMLGEIIELLIHIYPEPMNGESKVTECIRFFKDRIILKRQHWKDILKPIQLSDFGKTTLPTKLHENSPVLVEASKLQQKNVTNSSPQIGLNERILSSQLPLDLLNSFLENEEPNAFCLLITGPSGSGKTHLCDQLERKALVANIQVIRPELPLDLMGGKFGDAESAILAIFKAAAAEKSVVILDNIEHILGEAEYDEEPHLISRLRSTFLGMLDTVKHKQSPSNMFVTCTSTRKIENSRCEQTITLAPPNELERRHMILSSLSLQRILEQSENESLMVPTEQLVNEVVECTVGRSMGELAQLCRQTISCSPPSQSDELERLINMKKSLQLFSPESLRSGFIADFVDITVFTARDLLSVQNGRPVLQLFGECARRAWEQLEDLIVTPLCHATTLDTILFGSSRCDANVVCGGVLLTGLPGVGKSALARHAAVVAASLLPSLKLLNVSCTSLIHKEVGGSEKALQRLFASARAAAPCILLMDGIENIAAVRGHDNTTEGTMDRVLSTLLIELDGVNSNVMDGRRIAVIGITHNVSWIDPALRRPGRLQKVVRLDLPDLETRRMIAIKELEPSLGKASAREISDIIAVETIGKAAADVIALCTEGRLNCVREHVSLNLQGQPKLKIGHFIKT